MLDLIHYAFQDLSADTGPDGSVTLRIPGRPLHCEEHTFDGTAAVHCEGFLVLEYRATDLYRRSVLRQPLLSGVSGDTETPLLYLNDIIADGQLHRVIAACGETELDRLRLSVSTYAPCAHLSLTRFYTCTAEELPARWNVVPCTADGHRCIDLAPLVNVPVPQQPERINDGIGWPEGRVGLDGIPFAFCGGMLRPASSPAENDEIIHNINTEARRGLCRPVSRESRIAVPVGCAARELYFALYLDGFLYERCGFCAPDATILGSANGEVLKPLAVNDIERFAVLVRYADGTVDECFPQRTDTLCHALHGGCGVYGVRTRPGVIIDRVELEDRMAETDVCLCALTVNEAAPERLSERFPVRGHGGAKRFDLPGRITVEGEALRLQNGALDLTLDTRDGLTVRQLRSGFADRLSAGGALLKIIDGDKTVERFERVALTETGVTYRYGAVELTVTFDLSVPDGVRFGLTAVNRGAECRLGIRFPALDDVCTNSADDTWYFLPKYQNTESNGSCWVYEESAPSYPLQFLDIFSMRDGAGLALQTRERDVKVRRYGLIKQDGRTDAFIEYPAMYGKLEAGAAFTASETVLYVHTGDWRTAMKNYKDWLDSWYAPHDCQDKTWYRQKFWLLAEIPDFFETMSFTHFPVWYTPEDGKYHFQEIMDEITEVYGATPDILHMWAWTWDNERRHQLWGNYNTYDYDRIGGLENFRAALQDVSRKTGAEISLYMHPTLLSDVYPYAKEYFDKGLRVRNEAGNYISLHNNTYRMCHANEEWRDRTVAQYPRVHRETGVRLLYVDEFSLRVENRCYADGHGHEIPSNLLKTDREFITRLKAAMPKDVVLYGEYYPVDINAAWIDCNISYYILDSINAMIEQGVHAEDGSDAYGRVFTDVYRFMFPGIVQLILPMAMRKLTWQPLKATFFNGEAIYDSFWDVEESRGREFMARSFRIKKAWADCFASDAPQTMIDTPADCICANRFAGQGRNVYTLFNRAYYTYDDEVLALPYREGASYRDIWNDCPAAYTVRDGISYIRARVGAQNVGAIAEVFD